MKFFRNLFLSLSLLFGSIALVACGGKATVQIDGVDYDGLSTVYYVEDSVDFNNIVVTINYSDSTQQILTHYELDLEDVGDAAEDTEFIIYTDGLADQESGSLIPGDYEIEYYLIGESSQKENLLTITIADNQSEIFDLDSFGDPELVTAYTSRKIESVSMTDEQKESAFYNDDAIYQVGDDNEFVFKPSYVLIRKGEDEPTKTLLKTTAKVYLGTGDDKVLCETDEYYTYNPLTFGFDFTENAIGETFTIEVRPEYYTNSGFASATFVVNVQDGWNVHTALDLGILNINDLDTDSTKYRDGSNNLTPYGEEHYTDYAGHYAIYRNDGKKIFYDLDTQSYYAKSNNAIWQNFLKTRGYTDEDFASIGRGVRGLFVHKNIFVTKDALPEELFIYEGETTADTSNAAGSLRDYAMLYQHFLTPTQAEGDGFIFNGNFFTINFENVPLVESKHVGKTSDNTSRLELFTNSNPAYFAVRSSAFMFGGLNNFTSYSEGMTIKNLNTIGNSGGLIDSEHLEKAGSLILFKMMKINALVENNISKNFLISWYTENRTTLTVDTTKTYDNFNSGLFSWGGAGISTDADKTMGDLIVTNSEFKRFGGPVALLVSTTNSNYQAVYQSKIKFDDNTVLDNPVNGTEAWFALNKASQQATQLISLDALYNAYGAKIKDKNDKINLITLSMDQDYMASSKKYTYTETSIGDITFKDYGDNSPNLNPNDWQTKAPASADFVSFLASYSGNTSGLACAIDTPTESTVMASATGPLCPANLQSYYAIMGISGNVDSVKKTTPLTGDYTHINYHIGSKPMGIVLKMYTLQQG